MFVLVVPKRMTQNEKKKNKLLLLERWLNLVRVWCARTLYSGSGNILSRKHTKFCGNSYLNVQNINSSRSDECTISLCNAGKSLYFVGAFGLRSNEKGLK